MERLFKIKDFRVTGKFGYRTHPVTGEKSNYHPAIDVALPVGTPLYMPYNGYILANSLQGGHGLQVSMTPTEHPSRITLVSHLSSCSAVVGRYYKQGVLIGHTGGAVGAYGAGSSTGPHAHVMDGIFVNGGKAYHYNHNGIDHSVVAWADPTYIRYTDKPQDEHVVSNNRNAQDGFFKVDLQHIKEDRLNIRDNVGGNVIGKLVSGDEIRYDSYIRDAKHTWVSYMLNGQRVYVAWRVNGGVTFGSCRLASKPAGLRVGDKVKIKDKFVTYEGSSKGKLVSDYALRQVCNIVEIKDGNAKLDPINSWVKVTDLIKL